MKQSNLCRFGWHAWGKWVFFGETTTPLFADRVSVYFRHCECCGQPQRQTTGPQA